MSGHVLTVKRDESTAPTMCYESLVEGDATDRPLAALLRAELRDALQNGLGAAAIVVAVLATRGVDPVVTAVAAAGALALGGAVHQALLVAAVVALRARASTGIGRQSNDAAGHEA
jgi:hypothetical protein